MKNKLEKEMKSVKQKAFDWVYSEIKRYCKKKQWTFSTMWCLKIKNKHGDELESEKNYLRQLIYWYEDNIELFPQIYIDENGVDLSIQNN